MIKPTITKDLFVTCIQSIQDTYDFQMSVSGLASKYNREHRHEYVDLGSFEYPDCTTALQELLEVATYDTSGWISYFCWELDFGREYKPGTVTDNGKDVPLATIDDLWEVLNEEH